ncbi:LysR family transcriptional regulator [Lampropedia aestuarii]|uniref:LysR family transcriptional regulator n=1 Tax=Lampropedia aestuarii TaxID=2562762 RepID=UPI002468A79A|nr:LysR family transcriptional regulator [Lampropedia aestuarii]MDH5856575.1 LysR family transcriptional regulator [Lampropedia aestuarii]
MLPKIKDLQHLLFLAEEKHFAKAAQRAFLSQSAFSRSIAGLEAELGLKLFDRASRHVHITTDGARILKLARHLLASAANLNREAELLRCGEAGDIAIGSGPYTSNLLTVPVIAAARQRLHHVRFRLEVDHTAALLQKLEDEEIHLFLSDIQEIPMQGPWSVEPLGCYTSSVLCRRGHPLAKRRQLPLSVLHNMDLASVHIPRPIRRNLANALGYALPEQVPIAFECESVAALRDFVLSSDAVLLAPPELFHHELHAGLLETLSITPWRLPHHNPLRVDLGMVWFAERTPTSAMRTLMELVRQESQQRLSQGLKAYRAPA